MNDSPGDLVPAQTVKNGKGEILLFSWKDFVESICLGNSCFICGSAPGSKKFNDEHIVPNWVLHRFGLHGETVTLPNGQRQKYGTYKVPCCEDCNSAMSTEFETPMSTMVSSGPNALLDYVVKHGTIIPYTWMALIFLKVHLKDQRLRRHLDKRKGDESIASDYVWEHLHHLHAVARAFRIGANVLPEAIGSMFIFAVRQEEAKDAFDLATFTEAQTLYVRLGTTGIVAVFDDSCAAAMGLEHIISKIDGPVTAMQGREIAARMALANLDLQNRPQFWTHVTLPRLEVTIGGTTDKAPIFRELDQKLLGATMAGVFPNLPTLEGLTAAEAQEALIAGQLSFLFDSDGNFIKDQGPK